MSHIRTLAQARQAGVQALCHAGELAALEADCLLAAVTGLQRTAIIAFSERPINAQHDQAYRSLLARRRAGEPMAYLLGHRDFCDFSIRTSPHALIPRPETEHLVEAALERPAQQLLDLGTGSGCIAIALARAWPHASVHAVDCSADALTLARKNAALLNAEQIKFFLGDWYAPVSGSRYDLIVSNPPYIGRDEPELQQGDVQFEPPIALVADNAGLSALEQVIAGARAHLSPGGRLWVEHGYRQAELVRQLMQDHQLCHIETRCDLAGHQRITGAYAP